MFYFIVKSGCQDNEAVIDANSENFEIKPANVRSTIMLNEDGVPTLVYENKPISLIFTPSAVRARFTELQMFAFYVSRVTVKFKDSDGNVISNKVF